MTSARIRVGRVTRALAQRAAVLRGAGLAEYDAAAHRDDPTVFVGVYGSDDLPPIAWHRGPALVKLCGGDARGAGWMAGVLNALPRPRVRVLAGTPLRTDCERHGLRADEWRNVYIGDATAFRLARVPLGTPHVYVYCPWGRREEYGLATICDVARELPGVTFVIGRWGDHAPPTSNCEALPDWIPPEELGQHLGRCCAAIRTIPRDGFSVGAAEAAMMGRAVAHVADMGVPWIEHAPTVAALATFVERAVARRAAQPEIARAARAHAEDDSWLRLPPDVGVADAAPIAVGCGA